jgi:hypothetical protein
MTAEYYSAGAACQDIIHYRQLSADLGWPLLLPTLLIVDNKTMISLATSPEVSRKSKHIAVKHHYIRELVATGVVSLSYVPSKSMHANVLTKHLPRGQFVFERDALFNRGSLP